MNRSDRIIALAVAASVALHLLALFATPAFDLGAPDPEPAAKPLEARIVEPWPAPVAAAAPAAKVEQPAARPRVASKAGAAPKRAAAASPAAPRWLMRPDDLGAVPPLPDGGFADASSRAEPVATGDASASREGDATADAAYPVHQAKLVYDLFYGGGKAGVLTHTWWTDGSAYRVESVAEGVGLVKVFFAGKFVQRSIGRVGPAGLEPIEYTIERGSVARTETARFDWRAGKLSLAWKNERRVVDLPAGTQDALSILHQAYFVPPTATAAPLGVATSRKIGHYIYEVIGEALIETPLGILRTVHIRRADDDGTRIDAWLDRDRSLLPARVLGIDRRGNAFEQMIREAVVEG